MTISRGGRVSLVVLAGFISLAFVPTGLWGQAAQQDRILRAISNSDVRQLHGNLHPLARPEFDRGKVADSTVLPRITMFFSPSPSQQAELGLLLSEQQDGASPNFHRWLTPSEFGARFGLSENDRDKIVSWIESRGFVVRDAPESRNAVSFSGSAAQVAAAFATEIHRYVVDGEEHYANATEPSTPAALDGLVSGIAGLDDFRPRPRIIQRNSAPPQRNFTDGTGNHFLGPADFGAIYDVNPLYNRGIDGTGQKIAVAGQSDIQLSDVQEFRALMNLPAMNPQILLVPGSPDPGFANGDFQEADLDVEWAGAIARNATIIYVNSNNAWGSLQYAVTNDIAPVISVSYGTCETPNLGASQLQMFTQIGQQANAQGQTIVAASGDGGAAGCDAAHTQQATKGLAVSLPASLPYVTAVGGSKFNEGPGTYWSATNNANKGSALSYIPEIGWNDTSTTLGIEATGGGASIFFSKPQWQAGAGVPSDGVRDVPDVSLNASANHDGYLICDETPNSGTFTPVCPNGPFGGFAGVGGTSASTPAFAGVVALLNQATNSQQGNINYGLYQLAASAPSAFHNIASGNNIVPCQISTPDCPTSGSSAGLMGYSAGPGYNEVTGLGSIDASLLAGDWGSLSLTADFSMTVSPPNLTLARGSTTTAQVNFADLGGLSGVPSFSCNVPSVFVAVTCSVTSAGAGTNAFTLTLTSANGAAASDLGLRDLPLSQNASMAEGATAALHAHLLGLWALVAFMISGITCLIAAGKLRFLPLFGAACCAVAVIGCAGAASGGGSNSATKQASATVLLAPTQAGNIQLTGTLNGKTHTLSIPLTVE